MKYFIDSLTIQNDIVLLMCLEYERKALLFGKNGVMFIGHIKNTIGQIIEDTHYKLFTGIHNHEYFTAYYKDGKLHKEDGEAVLAKPQTQSSYSFERNFYYYLNGIKYSFDQYFEKQKNTIYASKIIAEKLGSSNEL